MKHDSAPIQTTAKPRCPKCRSTTFTVHVTEEVQASALIRDGVEVENYGPTGGLPQRVAAHGECRCGHEWRFRNMWPV